MAARKSYRPKRKSWLKNASLACKPKRTSENIRALQELENFMSGFDQHEIVQQIAQAMQDIELVPSIEDYE